MKTFSLHDWNDVRLLLACAEHGGFAGAASALGLDQTTVSRRIANLETAVGRPLFNRRRSGATPTAVGLVLLEEARSLRALVSRFEETMTGLRTQPPDSVSIGASEGLLTYTLIPVLLRSSVTPQPIDQTLIRTELPNLTFTTALDRADIAVVLTSLGDVPPVGGAVRVRRIGVVHFVPAAAPSFLRDNRAIAAFDDLADMPLVDVGVYRSLRSLDAWNGLLARSDDRSVSLPTSALAHKAVVEGRGISILPSYSHFYERRAVRIDVPAPDLAASLWLVAHEDRLREPSVRGLYDLLARMFIESPWFRERQ
ncbi:MAG: LysR family transcriptional regulator [Magnetospirillum sp.]|nr:LysR family transcriptional regulator [Magnetospirillum sp.]